jgi:hypothetical protein
MKSLISVARGAVHANSFGRNKAGNIVIRKGFYYTNGCTSCSFARIIEQQMEGAGRPIKVLDHGEVWKPFKGGSGVASQSHWWVEITEGI